MCANDFVTALCRHLLRLLLLHHRLRRLLLLRLLLLLKLLRLPQKLLQMLLQLCDVNEVRVVEKVRYVVWAVSLTRWVN